MNISEIAPACVTCGATPAAPRPGHHELTCDHCDARERLYEAALIDLGALVTPIVTGWAQRHHDGGLGVRELAAVLDEFGVSYGHGPFTDTRGVVQTAVDAARVPTAEAVDRGMPVSSHYAGSSAVQEAAAKLALSVRECALLTPMSEKEVRAALNSGTLKGQRGARGKWIVLRAELEQFLKGG